MPRGRPPKGGGSVAGRTGSGRGRGRPKKDASSLSPAPELQQQQLPAAEPYQEDVWVQCDACQKWRRLPPSTTLEDDVPWYCNMNPDTNYRSCEIPEENYDAAKEVVVASTDPYYANLIPKDAEALRRELLAKATQLQTEAKIEAQAEQRRRKQTADKNATVFATVKDELQALVKACQQIINNAGSWMSTAPSTSPSAHQQHQTGSSVPHWVWSGLQHFAPKPAQVAAQANEVLTSLECFAPGAQHAAEAAASEAGIRVSDLGAGGGAEPREHPPPPSTASAATTTSLPSQPANASHSHAPNCEQQVVQQQQQQQQQRQRQQIEAARVHARLALLVAASISLPSIVQAQATPDALVLPSVSSSKSGKGKQQQQQQQQHLQPELQQGLDVPDNSPLRWGGLPQSQPSRMQSGEVWSRASSSYHSLGTAGPRSSSTSRKMSPVRPSPRVVKLPSIAGPRSSMVKLPPVKPLRLQSLQLQRQQSQQLQEPGQQQSLQLQRAAARPAAATAAATATVAAVAAARPAAATAAATAAVAAVAGARPAAVTAAATAAVAAARPAVTAARPAAAATAAAAARAVAAAAARPADAAVAAAARAAAAAGAARAGLGIRVVDLSCVSMCGCGWVYECLSCQHLADGTSAMVDVCCSHVLSIVS
uniref:CW-type domain-containing protein n=1 Tax=Dunaliella tertiolecta TaxID=3047 RepID=A0A7S3R5R5_DUNTE